MGASETGAAAAAVGWLTEAGVSGIGVAAAGRAAGWLVGATTLVAAVEPASPAQVASTSGAASAYGE